MMPWLLGCAVFLLVVSTSRQYGLTWDEPTYFHAIDLHTQWLTDFWRNLLHGQMDRSLQEDVIDAAWHWDPYHVPHPPFSRILSALTKTVFSPILDKFVAYRLPSAVLFALLVTVMYLWIATFFDRATAWFSALTLVLIPNLFAQAHFAMTDIPITTLWFLAVYLFWKGLKDWRWSMVLGVVWGFALATKFPALLIPIPLLLWAHLYHRHSYSNNLFSMLFISPVVMVACYPYWWHKTLPRLAEFIYESTSRAFRPETNFGIFYAHRILPTSELPWYYPFFMTAVTIPETILLLFFVGLSAVFWLKPQREIMVLFLLNGLFVLTTGLFPGGVLHDVNRLMLPAIPFLVGVASAGFFFLMHLIQESRKITTLYWLKSPREKLIGIAFVLALLPAGLDLWNYHPYQLSYYNRLVGGIRGAYQRGFEVTYLMEAYTPGFLQHLNEKLPPKTTVNASFSNFMFNYYQEEKRLRQDITMTDGKDFAFYILLNRRSSFSEEDWSLIAEKLYLYDAFRFDGVPLILIYKPRP